MLSKPETRELYDRYGHAGLRARRLHAGATSTSANLGDIFSAFFGDDLFGRSRGGRARGGGRRRRGRDRARRGVHRRRARRSRSRSRPPASAATATAPSRAPSRVTCPTCGGQRAAAAGLAQRLRRVRAHAGLPALRAARAASSRRRAASAPAPAACSQRRRSRSRSRPASTTASGSASAARATPARTAARPATPTSRCTSGRDERLERDGNDILTTVDLTIVEAARGAKVTVPTLEGDLELEFEPGTQPGEVLVLRGKGMPSLQRSGRGDQRVLVNVLVPRRLTDEQRSCSRASRSFRRGHLPARRGLLREAQKRAPLSILKRVSITVPARAGRAGARGHARALPGGLRGGRRGRRARARGLHERGRRGADLAGLRRRGGRPRSATTGRTAGASSTGPSGSAASGSARRGSSRTPTRSRS